MSLAGKLPRGYLALDAEITAHEAVLDDSTSAHAPCATGSASVHLGKVSPAQHEKAYNATLIPEPHPG